MSPAIYYIGSDLSLYIYLSLSLYIYIYIRSDLFRCIRSAEEGVGRGGSSRNVRQKFGSLKASLFESRFTTGSLFTTSSSSLFTTGRSLFTTGSLSQPV
jgi:hypothetical protein